MQRAEPPADERARAFRVALIQTKPRKGEYEHNLRSLREPFEQVAALNTDVVVLPEAALTGYFLEGGVYELAKNAQTFADDLSAMWNASSGGRPVDIVAGFYENAAGTYYNSAVYLEVRDGAPTVRHLHRKIFLPTYGVFDEERFLSRGRHVGVVATRFGPASVLICEDVWHAIVPTLAAIKGARYLYVCSAAPGRGIDRGPELGSIEQWRRILRQIAGEHGIYVLYAGLAGFEGGKGMTGSSAIVDPRGEIVAEGAALGACIVTALVDPREMELARASLPLLGDLHAALPDLLLDPELPLPRQPADAADR